MCEYCGCQALTAIAELTGEHDLIVELAGEVTRALQAGELDLAADRTRLITAVLMPHTAVEEDGLFPALSAEFGGQVAGLVDEHRLIEAVLAESARETPGDAGWPERLTRAMHQLRQHILKEQDGAFPAALAVLDADQWDEVDAVRARLGRPYLSGQAC
jgi:hemerythrin-like domain-containing protein